MKYTTDQIERFKSKIHVKHPSECWVWCGYRDPRGYGHVTINSENLFSHRVAFEIENGEIPSGMFICHRCDNPSCCNPNHLFLGTRIDNQRDAARKGRMRPGVKLSDNDVEFIRNAYAKTHTGRTLAKMFHISESYAFKLSKGKKRGKY